MDVSIYSENLFALLVVLTYAAITIIYWIRLILVKKKIRRVLKGNDTFQIYKVVAKFKRSSKTQKNDKVGGKN